MIKCDCDERVGIEINSYQLFENLIDFFRKQVEKGVFIDIPVEKPHYVGYDSNGKPHEWYANKWYKCKVCGTLWEFDYPDFPAKGFVRKFSNGKYRAKD